MENSFETYINALDDEVLLENLLTEPGVSRLGLEDKIISKAISRGLTAREKSMILCIVCVLFGIGSYWGYTLTNYFELVNPEYNPIFSGDGLIL